MKKFETFRDALYELFDHNSLWEEDKVSVESLPEGWYLSVVGDDLFSEDGVSVCVFNQDDEVEAQYDISVFTYADLLGENWIERIAGNLYNDFR